MEDDLEKYEELKNCRKEQYLFKSLVFRMY